MSFTDLQLKQLKARMWSVPTPVLDEELVGIIERLEAAENLLDLWLQLDDDCEIDGSVFDKAMDVWRKAAGRVQE